MKYSSLIGLILFSIGLLLYILQTPDYTEKEFYIAAMLGLGLGLVLGGIMGFAQKKRIKQSAQPAMNESIETPVTKEQNEEDSGLKL